MSGAYLHASNLAQGSLLGTFARLSDIATSWILNNAHHGSRTLAPPTFTVRKSRSRLCRGFLRGVWWRSISWRTWTTAAARNLFASSSRKQALNLRTAALHPNNGRNSDQVIFSAVRYRNWHCFASELICRYVHKSNTWIDWMVYWFIHCTSRLTYYIWCSSLFIANPLPPLHAHRDSVWYSSNPWIWWQEAEWKWSHCTIPCREVRWEVLIYYRFLCILHLCNCCAIVWLNASMCSRVFGNVLFKLDNLDKQQ